MVNRPRWLSTATLAVMFSVIVVACTPAAGPTASPTTGPTTGATGTPAATGTPGASGTPAATGSPAATGTPAPTGTAYPSALEQPGAVADITDKYPNYGGDVDCKAGSWNGLPYTGNLKSLTATDDHTVVFTFCNPDVAFLSKIAFSVFAINDSDWLIAHTGDAAKSWLSTLNGTGPLKMDTWTRGSEIDYSRFDDYWGTEKSAPAKAVLRWAAESSARFNELGSGTIDGMTLVGPTDFDKVSGNPELSLKPAAGLNTLYLGMNHNFAPWDNAEVRKAIAVGLDRQRIVAGFMPPGSEVATHFTPCAIPYACTGDPWPDSDIAGARAKITEIFGEAGLTTTLAYRPPARGYIPLPAETAQDVQAQLEAINIHASLDEQQSATYIANSNTGKLTGLFLLGWGADYPDVTNFLDYHFGSGCTLAFGDCYPDIYQPLTTGGQTAVDADRTAAYTAANNAIREQVPMVPISHAGFANAYLADVGNQEISPLGNELLFKMTPSASHGDQLVFMQTAEPGSLYCADESDGEALRACMQSMESLYGFKDNDTATEPALATDCSPNAELTVWTCALREGVKYHDGATFEAKDVLVSLVAQWDALSPLHKGATGAFSYWPGLWGGFLNPPAPCGISGQPVCE